MAAAAERPSCERDGGDLVLITGATGYIGSHVAQLLLEDGYRLRVAARGVSASPKVQKFKEAFAAFAEKLEFVEADLLDRSVDWGGLMQDCRQVMHVASSFPERTPRSAEEADVLIRTAVGGTAAVLRAAAESPSVRKVVVTSSVAAIAGLSGEKGRMYSEEDWLDTDGLPLAMTYERSKALAEREAWRLHAGAGGCELVCVNPSVVLGPVLLGYSTSLNVVKLLLTRPPPLLPKVSMPCVDVRDVARAHVLALRSSAVDGQRVVVHAQTLTLAEIARTLQQRLGRFGYRPTVREGPDWLFRALAHFDANLLPLLSGLGRESVYDNTRMRQLLQLEPRPIAETIEETAHSLIAIGEVAETPQYSQWQRHQQQQQQQ